MVVAEPVLRWAGILRIEVQDAGDDQGDEQGQPVGNLDGSNSDCKEF